MMTKICYSKGLRFATWHVRTLYQVGKSPIVCKILEKYNLCFLGISENRCNQFGKIMTNEGHTMLWSGKPNDNDPNIYGLGILISKNISSSLIDYKFKIERIMLTNNKTWASFNVMLQLKNLTLDQTTTCYGGDLRWNSEMSERKQRQKGTNTTSRSSNKNVIKIFSYKKLLINYQICHAQPI